MTLHAEHPPPTLDCVFEFGSQDLTTIGQDLRKKAKPEEIITQMVEQVRTEISCDAMAALYDNRFLTSIDIDVCPLPRCPHPGHLHLDDGPCRYALDHGEPTRITDTKWSLRWSQWSKRVAKQGFRSTLSIAVRSQANKYGSLTLFNHSAGAFTPYHVAAATPLIDNAVLALEAAATKGGSKFPR